MVDTNHRYGDGEQSASVDGVAPDSTDYQTTKRDAGVETREGGS